MMAPARTGTANKSKKAVINIDQTNNGILCKVMPGVRMLKIVVIKLAAPRIDDAPARCSENIARSIDIPGVPALADNGGYIVQPTPAPPSITADSSNRINEGGNSQKLILFIRGNAMSGAPIIIGTNQLPKPPIRPGITTKNTMIRPWAVVNTFHTCPLSMYCTPGCISSMRM